MLIEVLVQFKPVGTETVRTADYCSRFYSMPELNPTPNQNDMKSNSTFRYIEYLSTFLLRIIFRHHHYVIIPYVTTRTKPKRAPILAGLKIRLIRTSSNPDRNSLDVAGSSRSLIFGLYNNNNNNNNQTQQSYVVLYN
jgi:hypothetical protein